MTEEKHTERGSEAPTLAVYTIGHSVVPIEEFLHKLTSHGVRRLVDIRALPRSRRHPQFTQAALEASLGGVGIAYTHMPGLGGLRKPRPDSPNMGLRHEGFRAFADYMLTAEFEGQVSLLMEMARAEQLSVMCAEAVPWRCHRSLLADALLLRGVEARHILSPERWQAHHLTAWAQVEGTSILYPLHPMMERGKGTTEE